MIRTPAQHQTDVHKKPGQIVNDVTLADYYDRKMKEKMTFEEWYNANLWRWDFRDDNTVPVWIDHVIDRALKDCWNASRENM